jgi:uncharacterized membrane protein YwaF|tara:strand:- start:43562 stop:43846 length:285 start_codon:yes stop_codon:yes gene_type:complete
MKKADEKFLSIWEKHLEKGKLQYVLKNAISWGIFMFLFMGVTNYFLNYNENPMSVNKYILSFFFWQIGGIGYGLLIWFIQNKRYEKLKKAEPSS